MSFMSTSVMAWIAGSGLALFLAFISYAILAPRKHRDPHDGMAVGLLMILALPAIAMVIVLAIGILAEVRTMVVVSFWIVAVPLAYLIVMLSVIGAVRWYKSKHEWQPELEDETPSAEPR